MSTMSPPGKCVPPQFCKLYLKINAVDQDQDSEIINATFWDHLCNAFLCLISHPLINDLPGKLWLLLKEETKKRGLKTSLYPFCRRQAHRVHARGGH